MNRAISVVLVALLTAVMSGIDESWASQTRTAAEVEAHRQQIADRLKNIPIGSPIEIEPETGREFQAYLESVTPDEITVKLVSGRYSLSRTVRVDEIRNLKRIRSVGGGPSTAKKVAIGVGIGLGVAVGVCAASLNGASTSSPGNAKPSSR